jgi:hypothetical protein
MTPAGGPSALKDKPVNYGHVINVGAPHTTRICHVQGTRSPKKIVENVQFALVRPCCHPDKTREIKSTHQHMSVCLTFGAARSTLVCSCHLRSNLFGMQTKIRLPIRKTRYSWYLPCVHPCTFVPSLLGHQATSVADIEICGFLQRAGNKVPEEDRRERAICTCSPLLPSRQNKRDHEHAPTHVRLFDVWCCASYFSLQLSSTDSC